MITDAQARKIASDWHGGGGSALYALASTGAINTARADHDITAELGDCFADIADNPKRYQESDGIDLHALATYVRKHRPRGPQPGWADLWPEEPVATQALDR